MNAANMPGLDLSLGSESRFGAGPDMFGRGRLVGRRMLVTDGGGLVGSHIVDLLVEGGCDEVIILDDLVEGRVATLAGAMESGRIRLVVAGVEDTALLAGLLQGIDTVFHQPAVRRAAGSRHAMEALATATAGLLERCLRVGVRKVVMTCPVGCISEDAAQGFEESLLRSVRAMHGLSWLLLRHAETYGPRMGAQDEDAGLLIRWIERLAAGLPPLLPGDGQRTVELVHAEDVARATLLAALSPAANLVLDIGSGQPTCLSNLARLLARVMGRRDLHPEARPEQEVRPAPHRCADLTAAQDRIGFRTDISLEEGLEALVTWWCIERDRAALQDVAI